MPPEPEFLPYPEPTPPAEPLFPPPGPVPTPIGFRCPTCGSTQSEEGFVDGIGDSATRWIAGPLQVGLLGTTKKWKRVKRIVVGRRCTGCSRLELFAGPTA